jgi:hypothetical protein
VSRSKALPAAFACACLILGLSACGPKTPPDPAPATDTAPAASDAASDIPPSGQAAADAAISSAAAPSAGTVANAKGDNQKTTKPSATISEQAEAGGDEAPQDLRNKVAAAKAAGKATGSPQQ